MSIFQKPVINFIKQDAILLYKFKIDAICFLWLRADEIAIVENIK
ncbi:MAG: hypothetical protein Q8M39_08480 [Sulfuricurvum sp.]|nr:hypothetical protein [Sulfuricurvum sp.]